MSVSSKLGLVATSYTETEIVADGERFPKCSWFRHFRLAQDNEVKDDVLMQDNECCALLNMHHPFYVRKGSKYINVWCFFVVDKIEKKEVKIMCCPTGDMVACFSVKPLQGRILATHRNVIQGVSENYLISDEKLCREVIERYDLWDENLPLWSCY